MSEISFGKVALMVPGEMIERGAFTLEAHRIAFGARAWTIWEGGLPVDPNILDAGDATARFRAALGSEPERTTS